MLQEFNKHIPVDVCFVQDSFQTIIKLKEGVMLNGKQMKVNQSLFLTAHFFKDFWCTDISSHTHFENNGFFGSLTFFKRLTKKRIAKQR